MLALASAILAARSAAHAHACVATVGKVLVEPGGVNAIPSRVTAWLDARGPFDGDVRAVVASVGAQSGVEPAEESWTAETAFDARLAARLSRVLDAAPVLSTGAGHDAGVLATAGVTTGMVFVRNPTGISHSPQEHAEPEDCHRGVEALVRVVRELAG
jgi:N-carbamoyl-L-amino-acid hydrolase